MVVPWDETDAVPKSADGNRVGWTGHRRLTDPGVVRTAIAGVFGSLAATRCGADPRLRCIGSVAIGADLLACEEALRRGDALTVVLPFGRAAFEENASPDDAARIDRVLAMADAVEVADPKTHGLVDDPPSREDGYLAAGYRVVDGCDVLLAIWDGRPPRGPAGTGGVVADARRRGRPVVWIDAGSGRVAWPDGWPMASGGAS